MLALACLRWSVQSPRAPVLASLCRTFIISLAAPPPPPPALACRANDAFPLFGTLLFGLFAFYLQLAVVKGNFKFGLNLLLFRVHPMRRGATVMSSFLFNVGLILLATTATIQFCVAAFALYADGTAVLDIFGNQVGAWGCECWRIVCLRWLLQMTGCARTSCCCRRQLAVA